MKTIDRYLLRELAFPFIIALVGFLIFILLNLILGLRDFMLDRSIGLGTILRLLSYQLPFFLVLSLPVATLFAIFLALGRLAHDREIIALQASGISLKRIVLPILILSLVISAFDLFLNDRMVPWANYQYQSLIRQLILRRSTPQIQDNTFFKDSSGRFFYVKHYDRRTGQLEGIMVYDMAGAEYLPDLGGRYPNVIVAEQGSWDGEVWLLQDGVIHRYDDRGHLQYEMRFATLAINVGAGLEQLFLTQRTPQEMSLSELAEKIRVLKESGLQAEGLIVEFHSKISIPLAGFIFALFGAPLSLIFSARSRAAGIVLGVLFVGLFQGSLIWSETLGKRGIIPPALSAWLPNLIFGGLGLALFLVMDRASQLDLRERLRRALRLHLILGAILALLGGSGLAAERPRLELSADRLTISEDWSRVSTTGQVLAQYGEGSIRAESLELARDGRQWELRARGGIRLSLGELEAEGSELVAMLEQDDAGGLSLREAEFSGHGPDRSNEELDRAEVGKARIAYRGGRLAAEEIKLTRAASEEESWLAEARGGVVLEEERQSTTAEELKLRFTLKDEAFHAEVAELEAFAGEGSFVNARGEEHLLRYQGRRATLSFDAENEISLLNIRTGDFTTCSCSASIEKESYSISADRLLVFSDDLLVATNITLRAFGVPIFWAPLYLAPLKEEQKSPFLPEIGRSALRGWYAKWRLPFILSERTYGSVLLDYFNRYRQLGSGLDLNFNMLGHIGSLHLYKIFGELGLLELALSDRAELPRGVMLSLAADYRSQVEAEAEGQHMGYQAQLSGSRADWGWALNFSQDQYVGIPAEGEEIRYRALVRLPELALSHRVQRLGPLGYSLSFQWGRYQERKLDGTQLEGTRFAGLVSLGLEGISLHEGKLSLRPSASYQVSFYGSTRMETLSAATSLSLLPLERLSVSLAHSYRLVRGSSPFAFDTQMQLNRLDLRGAWSSQTLQGNLATSYDLEKASFDPLSLGLNYRLGLGRTTMRLSYDLNRGQLQQATIQQTLAREGWSFSAETGYNFVSKQFSDLIAKLALERFKIGLRYDLNSLLLKRINSEVSLELGEDWRLALAGEYDLGTGQLGAFQYGVVRSFCHNCWEIGLYGERGRVWLQAKINAFPTATIKYSPTDQELAFGE
ncbi:MAG: LptF/LptG family permease [Candidatus Acetothermia bacterium]|jgi:lipopolysaccharide export system permease protein|nr:LptF/LptG family permease [Candidatus Acetothermia bacterium]MDH7504874.1 LptF/LptG family permease [Candidatus Acetothermia bacterium]